MKFEEQLALGHLGEEIVVKWLQGRGWGVIPSYAYQGKDNKAPRLFFAKHSDSLVIPDVDACRAGDRRWIEIKTHYHAPMNTTHACPVHGITGRLRDHYTQVERQSNTPVWICVLEVGSGALLGARLSTLGNGYPCLCHGCKKSLSYCAATFTGGPFRGVYWPRAAFTSLAVFGDDRLRELRAKWPVPLSAKRATEAA